MNKKIILTCCALLAALSITSCSDGGGRTQSGKKKTLTYLISSESAAYRNILDGLLDEFNESIAADGYEIITEVPGGEYYQSLGNKFAANQSIDIFMMEIGYFNAYSKYMAPLDSYLSSSSLLSENDLWSLNDHYKDQEGLKALIKDFSPDFMLIYNKTMLDEYNALHEDEKIEISQTKPLTWTQFYKIASTMQAFKAEYGTSLGFEGEKHLHQLVQSTGSSMYSENYEELNISDPNVVASFEYFCALQKDNANFETYDALNQNSGKAPAYYTSGSNTSEQELFKQQRAFSIFNGLYSFAAYDFYNCNFEVGIAPSPVKDENSKPYSTTSAMISHAISKKCKYKDIAWKWLEFYQTEGLKRFAKIAFNIPGNKSVAQSDCFLTNENEKIAKMTNYFYNYVNDGYVYATKYNPKVSFTRIKTCFSTHMGKYYDKTNSLTFEELLEEINKSIKASI